MKGLLLKDYYTIIKYCRFYLIMLLIFIVISSIGETSPFFMFYPALIAWLIPVTLISIDEKEKWDIYCSTLPFDRKQMISEKYLLGFLFVLSVMIASSAEQVIRMSVLGIFSWSDLFLLSGTVFMLGLIGPSVLLPFIFKFGAEKGGFYTT